MKNKFFGLLKRKGISGKAPAMSHDITVKLHYHRPDGNYAGWNAWMWTLEVGGKGYELTEEDGCMVATMVVDGRYTTSVSFILRKGNWECQEYNERRIDVSTLGSGTVHYFVESGVESCRLALSQDARITNKIMSAELDYDTGFIHVRTAAPIIGGAKDAIRLLDITGRDGAVGISSVTSGCGGYAIKPTKPLSLTTLYRYKLRFEGVDHPIKTTTVYASRKFNSEFTYDGKDLGATWSKKSTSFKVWAPTAEDVKVALYRTGNADKFDRLGTIELSRGDKGVWSGVAPGNQNGVYYTYLVKVNGGEAEAVDPYARTTGVNGKRGMIIDLESTNPAGWDTDKNPNPIKNYTDAVLYELHVRDLSIDPGSGISEPNRGKFLGLTETGTKTLGGNPTGLDHIKSLGITHLHLLPVYDYGSVDESRLDVPQFNWGYDPINYNVPEGSYSTDPYNGAVRVQEMKQMMKALHDNGISVVMDVVYNHVFEAGTFCFNKIVPGYFSRSNADGSWSNGSGCGNDTASERPMVRKFIVDSIVYWNKEYHFDGFRFDLVGLLDTGTINALVDAVHADMPDAIFYGEGWTLNTAVEPGNHMATQPNAHRTPEFAYFSDDIRNLLAGENGKTVGFASGLKGKEDPLSHCFAGDVWWCPNPTQTVNYVSCHDNYTLMDKLALTRKDASREGLIRMNKLAAAIYMMSQGIPFIHAGEEFLREKIDANGKRVENSYNAPDVVNAIRWNWLDEADRRATVEYYAGLIAFRKAHASLRLTTKEDVAKNVHYRWITNELVLFNIKGKDSVADEVADNILVIFNANPQEKELNLYDHKVAAGDWQICINGDKAGTKALKTITDGKLKLSPISATVLVKGKTE
ncbi:MAG: type I pullulanase [Oscillospiraceae bacterium]|nr:type I pullulanase [Oscillospiraceae bacterium]